MELPKYEETEKEYNDEGQDEVWEDEDMTPFDIYWRSLLSKKVHYSKWIYYCIKNKFLLFLNKLILKKDEIY